MVMKESEKPQQWLEKFRAKIKPADGLYDPSQLQQDLDLIMEVFGEDSMVRAGSVSVRPHHPSGRATLYNLGAEVKNLKVDTWLGIWVATTAMRAEEIQHA